jgi:LAO/AO transport system kinase
MTLADPKAYVDGVRSRDRRMLSKTITLIESSLPEHQEMARQVLDLLTPFSGYAIRLGITGVPGVGKSTFIESLGMFLVESGHQLAVLAVDPSSARSGGSVMADKTRMEQLAIQQQAFIRPSPAGETLGGVARKTRETMLICEAAGYDVIVVETVGVGQSETAVCSMVDFFLVLMLAGAGDELQGIKKGVIELADAVVVNKADGANVENALKAAKTYQTALHLLHPATPTWSPPVLTCSALEMTGIDAIWHTVLEHREAFSLSGEFEQKRRQQALEWMWSLIDDGLTSRFRQHAGIKARLPKLTRAVEKGDLSPTAAAAELLFLLDNSGHI